MTYLAKGVDTGSNADQIIGSNIKAHRIRAGLSLRNFSRWIGVSNAQLVKYESGKNRVSGGMLWLIAQRLEIPVSDLFEDCPDYMSIAERDRIWGAYGVEGAAS